MKPFSISLCRPVFALTSVKQVWLALLCALVLVFAFSGLSKPAYASAQSRRVVTDPNSGLAIYGFDAVAYFTDQKAIKGKYVYEYVWKDVSWLFASEANKVVFEKDPEVYAPEFGGHGALAMARGYVATGNPEIWAIYQNRLYFFYSYTNRAAWAQAVDQHVDRAQENWQSSETQLSR
jgi:YHS domain-containing protein